MSDEQVRAIGGEIVDRRDVLRLQDMLRIDDSIAPLGAWLQTFGTRDHLDAFLDKECERITPSHWQTTTDLHRQAVRNTVHPALDVPPRSVRDDLEDLLQEQPAEVKRLHETVFSQQAAIARLCVEAQGTDERIADLKARLERRETQLATVTVENVGLRRKLDHACSPWWVRLLAWVAER